MKNDIFLFFCSWTHSALRPFCLLTGHLSARARPILDLLNNIHPFQDGGGGIVKKIITRPNCALDRRTFLGLYVRGFQNQGFKHVKILSERSKRMKEQKKNKENVLVAESACNSQDTQFGLFMIKIVDFSTNQNATKLEFSI